MDFPPFSQNNGGGIMDERRVRGMHAPFAGQYQPAGAHAMENTHRAILRRRTGAHAMEIIASGDPSPPGRRPCDENHRIGRFFGGGQAPMR